MVVRVPVTPYSLLRRGHNNLNSMKMCQKWTEQNEMSYGNLAGFLFYEWRAILHRSPITTYALPHYQFTKYHSDVL